MSVVAFEPKQSSREALRDHLLVAPYETVDIVFCGKSRAFFEPNYQHPNGCWLCSPLAKMEKQYPVSAWFDIHRPEVWGEKRPDLKKTWHKDYQGWLRGDGAPIVMMTPTEDIGRAVQYPRAELEAAYPGAPFAGTTDWMIALAVWLGVKTINLWGIDYDTPHELLFQRFGVAYWIGLARGAGVTVNLPPEAIILNNFMAGQYGPDFPPWPTNYHPAVFDNLMRGLPRPWRPYQE